MKTVLRKILLVAVVLGTYTGYANERLEVEVTSNIIKKGTHIPVSDAKGDVKTLKMMSKLYKLQLIIMSPLLLISLVIIIPIYYIYIFADMILFKQKPLHLVLQQT